MTASRMRVLIAGLVGLLLVMAFLAQPAVEGLAFVVRVADLQGTARVAADHFKTGAFTERPLDLPLPRGTIDARLYWPAAVPRRTVLLVSGLHPAGIDEPRLVGLARNLARSGIAVVTPDIAELSRFEISPAITDQIEQSVTWLAGPSGLSRDGQVGLMGISFSGGLSLVAAGRPALRGKLAYVFSFGGHDDLPRVLRYLCTGIEPARARGVPPVTRPPHDYGVAVILLAVADRLVPPDQVGPLRDGVRQFLWASHLDRVDKPAALASFAAVREQADRLPEPSGTLLRLVTERDVARLGPKLLPALGSWGGNDDLSPSRAAVPTAPVFLLHGTEDNVIPAVETAILADSLQGHVPLRVLASELISHAEADRPPHARDVWQLATFWGDLLSR